MISYKILPSGNSAALSYAVHSLEKSGFETLMQPDAAVTHLLLPVPSPVADSVLARLPKTVTVIGGNLPVLEQPVIDLLKDPTYVSKNAGITAHCAIKLAINKLTCILPDCKTLIIGWGRIGKCLAKLLRDMGCPVTVAARKEADRAMLAALGYDNCSIEETDTEAFDLIFNTAPEMLFPECPGNALKIDLASKLGLGGSDVLWARGLPGKMAPISSGQLIAETVLRLLKKEESA